MKNLSVVFSFCIFLCSAQKLSASDTLCVVTRQGTYLFDVDEQQRLSPVDFVPDNILFSTEGLSHLVEVSDREFRYYFEEKNFAGTKFEWWSLSLVGSDFPGEIVNFDSRPESSGYIMYPLCWSSDLSSLYLFSTNGDALDNEKGIFKYDFKKRKKKRMTEVIPADSYSRLPLMNDERKALYFLRDGEVVRLNLLNEKEEVLFRSDNILRLGIMSKFSFGGARGGSCAIDFGQPELKSPFKPYVDFCVTRMGFDDVLVCDEACSYQTSLCSSLPYCEGHCSLGCTNCRDAVDMDVLDDGGMNRMIVASANGYVVRAQTNCPVQGMGQGYGFGHHVVIRHGNQNDESAPETLYAHMSELFVEEGQFVYMGQHIGVLGDSQVNDCNGDGILDCECQNEQGAHVHYEYHNGAGSLYSTTDIFAPVFIDVGSCVVQPNNSYTTNFSGMENVYPYAGNYDIVGVDITCGGFTKVTIVGETCACCESLWYPHNNNQAVVGDTVVLFLTEEQVNGQCFYFARSVLSPCINVTSGTDAISVCLTAQHFAGCVPGCGNELACNFNPLATYNDGSCDFSCLASCELADTNHDNEVDVQDILSVLTSLGSSEGGGDVNQDGGVGVTDLMIVISYFGEECE